MTERLWPPKARQLDLGDDDFPLPPADLRERVIGVSVFTHLLEEFQDA